MGFVVFACLVRLGSSVMFRCALVKTCGEHLRYSNWKTYPQLYVNGELIGGVDLMKEMEDVAQQTSKQIFKKNTVEDVEGRYHFIIGEQKHESSQLT